jgi:hypothetical protein
MIAFIKFYTISKVQKTRKAENQSILYINLLKMKIKYCLLIFTFLMIFSNCQNKPIEENNPSTITMPPPKDTQVVTKKFEPFKILNKEKYETGNKAQLKIYAYLLNKPGTKEGLENTIINIYEENKNEGGYKNFTEPTVVTIYLFTSENKVKEMPDQWIAMLSKGPDDSMPRISIDDLKLKSQAGLNDTHKSEDEIELERLTKYLQKRGLKLCAFYKQIGDMELDCIHKADKRYPDFGINHGDYAEKLMVAERKKLIKKYKISDETLISVNVFGGSYCK